MIKLIDNKLDILIFKKFLNKEQADWLFNYCNSNIVWHQDRYNFGGREVLAPRLTALYGSKSYSYSGQTLNPIPFTKALNKLKSLIEKPCLSDYNIVLLNQYRNGEDSVSWHTDAEKSLGKNPIIASISIGCTRNFKFREKNNHKNQHQIELEHGDLIIMKGETQHYWEHCVTFRKII